MTGIRGVAKAHKQTVLPLPVVVITANASLLGSMMLLTLLVSLH